MSVHKECGEPIRWARNHSDTKWLPPLELVGEAFILLKSEGSEGEYVGSEVMTYRIHNCDPDKVEAWQAYKARLAEIDGREWSEAKALRVSDREAARMRDMENAWNEVYGTPCRKCDCPTDDKCINLSKTKPGGEVINTRWPHPERVEDAQRG